VAAPVPAHASSECATGAELALPKLRALLFDRVAGMPLRSPGSPRYLALADPRAQGTRLFFGWVLPGLGASELPELRAVTDALAALAKLNHLDVAQPIKPGLELRLSDRAPLRPKLYVVRPGDDLAKVARHFGISEKSLLEANRLEVRQIHKGQKLVLPR